MSPKLIWKWMTRSQSFLADRKQRQIFALTGVPAFLLGPGYQALFPRQRRCAGRARKRAMRPNGRRWQRISTFPQPTTSTTNGFCFGGGFTQVCACDLAPLRMTPFSASRSEWGIFLPGGIVSWNIAGYVSNSLMGTALTDTFPMEEAAKG